MRIPLYKCKNCSWFTRYDKNTNTVFCNYEFINSVQVTVDMNEQKVVDCPKKPVGVTVKIVKDYNVDLPFYATPNSSGFDLAASTIIIVCPGERLVVPTGLKLEIPNGYELQIRPRSGLSLKSPLIIANSPGTIDADYRGEIGVIIWNTDNNKNYVINKGDRIAQGVLSKVERAKFVVVDELSRTDR